MLRGFTDSAGVEWRVWEVNPSLGFTGNADALTRSGLKDTPFAEGWLCFESPEEKRRLAPVPVNWGSIAPVALEQLCAAAVVVPARVQRVSG